MEGRDGDESGVRSSVGRKFCYCTPQNVIQEKIKGGSEGRGYLDEGGNGRVNFWGNELEGVWTQMTFIGHPWTF